jgi:uncharacterized small protein (DUF1192 family)
VNSGRDRYLLGEEEHPGRQATIQELIQRLEAEIARGEAVYSAAELDKLQAKLEGYRFNLLILNNP